MEKHSWLGKLRSVLTGGDSEEGAEALAKIAVGANLFPEQKETVSTLLKVIGQPAIQPAEPMDAEQQDHNHFSDPARANKLIVVNAIPKSHAEQNLALALLHSDYDTSKSVAIAGGKRPCSICYFSLCLVKEKFSNLTFNAKPGGNWKGTTAGGLWGIAKAMGLSDKDVAARAQHYIKNDDRFTSYVTATAPKKLGDKGQIQRNNILGLGPSLLTRASTPPLPLDVDMKDLVDEDYVDEDSVHEDSDEEFEEEDSRELANDLEGLAEEAHAYLLVPYERYSPEKDK